MQSNLNQLKIGSLLSYLQMFIGVLVGIVYTPIMLRLLGQSEYGLYNTVSSTIAMLSILSLGFNSGYIRYYSQYKKNSDVESIWRLNGLFLIIFSIIGIIALTCGLFLSFHLDTVFDKGLTLSEYRTARVLMILLTINLAISFPMSVFSNIISANERYIFLKTLGVIKTILGPLVTIPLLLLGFRSIAMVVVTILLAAITDILFLIYVLKVLNNKFIFTGFEHGLFKSLFVYTSFIAINLIIDQINWNVDKILLGRYQGTEAVAVYSVGYVLYQYYMMFSTSISSVFTPRIHRIITETQFDLITRKIRLTELFIKVGRIQFMLLGLVATGLVFWGQIFITNYWAGKEYYDSYYVMLLLVLPASIALIQNVGIEIQRAQNKHRFRAIAYLFMAIINVVISIELCQIYGAIGSAIGTAISLIIANGFVMNVYYHTQCNIDILKFWKNIMSIFRGMIIPIIIGIQISQNINTFALTEFLFVVFLYSIIYCISIWFLSMNQYEKDLIIKPLYKVVKKYVKNKG